MIEAIDIDPRNSLFKVNSKLGTEPLNLTLEAFANVKSAKLVFHIEIFFIYIISNRQNVYIAMVTQNIALIDTHSDLNILT